MPHKHKRRSDDKSFFDLPPTSRAKPLPTKLAATDAAQSKQKNKKRKRTETDDDTPKSFARLMRFQAGQPLPKGLDDGERKKRKRMTAASGNQSKERNPTEPISPPMPKNKETEQAKLKILPNERLADFAARVDQALPLSSLASLGRKKASSSSSGPGDPALKGLMKERSTKHNKRLGRMQREWRAAEAKRKDRAEAEMEEKEEELEEREGLLWQQVQTGKKNKNANANKGQKDDEDPWAELTRQKREATRQRGLQDVVQAPPQLDLSRARGKGRIFRGVNAVVDVENVPGRVGSLRRREEMAEKRREVIDGYRKKNGREESERINGLNV